MRITFRNAPVIDKDYKVKISILMVKDADTGAERHPNSHQRMMTFEGSGDMQTGDPGQWQSNVLVSDPDAPLEQRWISIPQNVWHRPVVGADADWTVVSFHTVPAEELIEEKPDDNSQDGTKQMKYLDRK